MYKDYSDVNLPTQRLYDSLKKYKGFDEKIYEGSCDFLIILSSLANNDIKYQGNIYIDIDNNAKVYIISYAFTHTQISFSSDDLEISVAQVINLIDGILNKKIYAYYNVSSMGASRTGFTSIHSDLTVGGYFLIYDIYDHYLKAHGNDVTIDPTIEDLLNYKNNVTNKEDALVEYCFWDEAPQLRKLYEIKDEVPKQYN